METNKITSLNLLTYSRLLNNIDQLKEKNVKSEYNFLNLKKLVQNFKLDIELDNYGIPGYIKSPPRPAFISKSYYQNNPEFAYNNPAKGPIPEFFECIYCEQEGPRYHLEECKKPFESSLYLTEAGEQKFKKPAGTSYKLIVLKMYKFLKVFQVLMDNLLFDQIFYLNNLIAFELHLFYKLKYLL